MEINAITYSHDQKVNHLQGVEGTIDRGEITTIIGPNGCGKSTLLGVMANHYVPQKGAVILNGKELTAYKGKELAQKLAVVHQHNSAPADMTVERLTSYGRLPYKMMFRSDIERDKAAVEWALEKTNLLDKRERTIDALSGGERQRVWIAMALAQQTPFLFLDEPTTYLDIYYQYEILELVKELNRVEGLTIVMVLHDINQAIRYSDTIIAMKDGKIVVKGEPEKVINAKLMKDVYHIDVIVKEDEETGVYTIPVGI
jgi:iron complex transport system ATP-binding protein